ncbi:ABC transporter substrate-binding protein [Pelagibacterium montanilacus]|uniref:ABC transporter substrate-binding protein n=1 Tax=Pelagibacterium montanilacus TaxID=2185280 RepID=UPI0013DF5E24|nr:ABC transporter substrate-binding protein [Pelagibacterium montanilacus]
MKLNRRHFLGGSAALAGFGAMPAITRSAFAQSDDMLRMAFSARGNNTLDPAKSIQGSDEWSIIHIFDKLVELPRGRFALDNSEFRPSLATSWEVSEDSTAWTFQLREGVQFHKGYGEMTSDDVVFTFERLLDPEQIGTRRVLFENISSIEAEGDYQVTFRLFTPDPLFLSGPLSSYASSIVPRAALEEKGEGFERDPIGTGPYVFERLDADPSQGVIMVANEDYFDGPPAMPRLQAQYILDTTAHTLALMSGEVHMIEGVRGPGWVPSIQQQNPNLLFDVASPGSFFSLHLNLTYPDFEDIRVRQALFYAIDRDEIAAAMAPISQRTYGVLPPSFPGGFTDETIPDEIRYDYSVERAQQLLSEAGKEGLSFNCFTSQREDYSSVTLIVQEQLRRAGIDMQLNIMDHTGYHAENNKGVNTLSQRSSAYPPVPTQPYLEMLSADAAAKEDGSGGPNFSQYGVEMPGIDDLLDQANNEPDFDARLELIRQMDEQVMSDAVYLPVSTNGYLIVRSPDVDLGYEMESGFAHWRLDQARLT